MKKMMLALLAAMCMLGAAACGSSSTAEAPAQTQAAVQETQAQQTEQSVKTTRSEQSDAEMTVPEQTEEQPGTDDLDASTGADTIVVYFSATGTTRGVAERIANVTNADLFELIPAEPYSDADLDWNDKNSRTTIEMNDPSCRPAIASKVDNMAQYDVVFVGFPVWWYREPSIIDTFMESYDFTGKTVVPFATSGMSPIGDAGANMQALASGAKVAAGKRFPSGVSAAELEKWASAWV